MSREAGPRTSPLRALLYMAGAIVLVALAGAGWKSYRDLAAARAREALLEERIRQTATRVGELRGRIERLRDDPVTLERLAREELGMVKPGDVGVVFPPEPVPAPSPPAAPAPPPVEAPPPL
jgi:cell division protein FtsB